MSQPLLLLVDDARDMALIVRHLGTRAGCVVEHRPDADSALEFLQDHLPDLLLLDVNLPGMNGPELCRQVRTESKLASLPIALFTHEGLADDVAAGLEAGADFHFAKDLVVSPEAWEERLREILEAVHSRPQSVSLRCPRDGILSPVPANWIATLNGALRFPALRGLGPSVIRVLLRTALSRVFGPSETDSWLTSDGCALDSDRIPSSAGPAAAGLVAALSEQVWCVMGTAASAPFRDALSVAFPGLPEPRTRR